MNINDLISNFKAMPEWEDRYAYIIELGRGLAPFSPGRKCPETLVKGCASQVWMDFEVDEKGRHHFKFDSDALIVKGLLFIMHALFEGKTAGEIPGVDAEGVFEELGLRGNLSAQRLVGLASIVGRIRLIAMKD